MPLFRSRRKITPTKHTHTLKYERDRGIIVCTSCGEVIQQNLPIVNDLPYDESNYRLTTREIFIDKNLGTDSKTFKFWKGKSALQQNNIRLMDWTAKHLIFTVPEYSHKKKIAEMNIFCSLINLPPHITKLAIEYFKVYMKQISKSKRNNYQIIFCAAIRAAILKLGYSMTLKQLAKKAGLPKKDIKKVGYIAKMILNTDKEYSPSQYYYGLANRVVSDLKLPPTILNKVLSLLRSNKIKARLINKAPPVIVGGLIYYALLKHELNESQYLPKICDVLSITPLAVKNVSKIIESFKV